MEQALMWVALAEAALCRENRSWTNGILVAVSQTGGNVWWVVDPVGRAMRMIDLGHDIMDRGEALFRRGEAMIDQSETIMTAASIIRAGESTRCAGLLERGYELIADVLATKSRSFSGDLISLRVCRG